MTKDTLARLLELTGEHGLDGGCLSETEVIELKKLAKEFASWESPVSSSPYYLLTPCGDDGDNLSIEDQVFDTLSAVIDALVEDNFTCQQVVFQGTLIDEKIYMGEVRARYKLLQAQRQTHRDIARQEHERAEYLRLKQKFEGEG